MFAKPAELPLSEELSQLGNEAFKAATIEWDGWHATPLTNSELFQINYIVNALIAKALKQNADAVAEAIQASRL